MAMSGDGGPAWGQAETARAELAEELYVQSGAERYGLARGEFTSILREMGEQRLGSAADDGARASFFRSLHLEELALARGCAAGNERAWEDFFHRYRERLYRAARGIAGEESRGRELADSVYVELYGTRVRDGERASKLRQYSGRGSLEGWLRTVLAQEHINGCRREWRAVSLDEINEGGERFAARPEDSSGADPRVAAATDEALAAIDAEERCLLAAYYLDGATLARIAGLLGVHESTISRKLAKLTKTLRGDIFDRLRRRGMSRRQAEEALEADVRDVEIDIRKRLAQDSVAGAFSEQGRAPGGEVKG